MIICDLYFIRPIFGPVEADSILIVDSDTVLSLSIHTQQFKLITRWNTQLC